MNTIEGQENPSIKRKRNHPVNCWWAAGTSEEITRSPLSRCLLDQAVVLFRMTNGTIVALDDRCPHRLAPLSAGRLVGDDIACPYHGFRYDARGLCTHIPTQSYVPPALKVRSYPVAEHGPFIWIWIGDPEEANIALLPDIPWPNDRAHAQLYGHVELKCDYSLLQENLMDSAHLDYLHSPANRDWLEPSYALRPIEVRATERTVTIAMRSFTQTYTAPGCIVQGPHPTTPDNSQTIHGPHCTTPISYGRCHWWWAYILEGFGGCVSDFDKQRSAIYKQDKDLLEAIQRNIDRDARDHHAPTFLVAADGAASETRKILNRMIKKESESLSQRL